MTPLYGRIFTQIFDSSLADHWQARHVFQDLLLLANNGILDMTRSAIARRTNVPIDVVNKALAVLEAPDPDSRDADEEGRRLVRLDEHRDWGWRIVNWDKYDAIRNLADQKAYERDRKRRQRGRQRSESPLASPESTIEEKRREDTGHFGTCPEVSRTNRDKRRAEARPTSSLTDEQWLNSLAADPAYQGIDVRREHAKMVRWCQENGKQPTRRRFVNWLNRADRPVQAKPEPPRNCI